MAVQSTNTTSPNDRFAVVGTTLDGKYRIDRIVAEGGFGVVYEGYHKRLQVPIALKVLKTLADIPEAARKEFATQFVREAQTTARIKHPNIVQVLDVGISRMPSGEAAAWMVLEWLTGETLQQSLRTRRGQGGRSPTDAMALFRPVIDAVAYAHDEGIAHRDLKPANIMLVETRRGVVPHVLDFGIAKAMEQDEDAGSGVTITRGTGSAFSPNYAAPEQVAGTRTGPWTDVHALALMFTELLTDTAPYNAGDKAELFSLALSPDRPTPRKFGFDAGPIEDVLRKAVAFRPDDRYRNAGELLAALDPLIARTSIAPPRMSGPTSLASPGPSPGATPSGTDSQRGDSSPSSLRAQSARVLDSEIPSGNQGSAFSLQQSARHAAQPIAMRSPGISHEVSNTGAPAVPAPAKSGVSKALVAGAIAVAVAASLGVLFVTRTPHTIATAPAATTVHATTPVAPAELAAPVALPAAPVPTTTAPPVVPVEPVAPAQETTEAAIAERPTPRNAPRGTPRSTRPGRPTRAHGANQAPPDDDFRPR